MYIDIYINIYFPSLLVGLFLINFITDKTKKLKILFKIVKKMKILKTEKSHENSSFFTIKKADLKHHLNAKIVIEKSIT